MTGKMLSKVGASLVRRFGTRDPFQIAKELGISVLLCEDFGSLKGCLLYTSPSPRDGLLSRMPSSA